MCACVACQSCFRHKMQKVQHLFIVCDQATEDTAACRVYSSSMLGGKFFVCQAACGIQCFFVCQPLLLGIEQFNVWLGFFWVCQAAWGIKKKKCAACSMFLCVSGHRGHCCLGYSSSMFGGIFFVCQAPEAIGTCGRRQKCAACSMFPCFYLSVRPQRLLLLGATTKNVQPVQHCFVFLCASGHRGQCCSELNYAGTGCPAWSTTYSRSTFVCFFDSCLCHICQP